MLHTSDAAIIFTCHFFMTVHFSMCTFSLFSHVRDSDNEDSLSAVIHIIIIGIEQRALGIPREIYAHVLTCQMFEFATNSVDYFIHTNLADNQMSWG